MRSLGLSAQRIDPIARRLRVELADNAVTNFSLMLRAR
jgi:hypothetical protein